MTTLEFSVLILPTAIRYDNKIERVLLFPSNYQATSKHVRAEGLMRSYKVGIFKCSYHFRRNVSPMSLVVRSQTGAENSPLDSNLDWKTRQIGSNQSAQNYLNILFLPRLRCANAEAMPRAIISMLSPRLLLGATLA